MPAGRTGIIHCYARDLLLWGVDTCEERTAANLQTATGNSFREKEMVNWGDSEVQEVLLQAVGKVNRHFSGKVNGVTQTLTHLKIWTQYADSLWVITLWHGSACSGCKVKAKAVEAYWRGFHYCNIAGSLCLSGYRIRRLGWGWSVVAWREGGWGYCGRRRGDGGNSWGGLSHDLNSPPLKSTPILWFRFSPFNKYI